MNLAQAIDEADTIWKRGVSSSRWEDFIAYAVIEWFRSQEETPTDIVSDY